MRKDLLQPTKLKTSGILTQNWRRLKPSLFKCPMNSEECVLMNLASPQKIRSWKANSCTSSQSLKWSILPQRAFPSYLVHLLPQTEPTLRRTLINIMIITTTAASNNTLTTNSMETTNTMVSMTIVGANSNNQSLVVSILIQMSRQLTILTSSSTKMNSETK